VEEVLRERGREIFRQIKAPNRRNTASMPRFGNAEMAGGKDPASTRSDFLHGLLSLLAALEAPTADIDRMIDEIDAGR